MIKFNTPMWFKKLICKFFGHDVVSHKYNIKDKIDFNLFEYECQRCGEKKFISWDNIKKTYHKV